MDITRRAGPQALALALCIALAAPAQAQPDGHLQLLQVARDWVNELRLALARSARDAEQQCRQADEADDRLADTSPLPMDELSRLSGLARGARASCDAALQLQDQRKDALGRARARLRDLTADIQRCAAPGSCAANGPDALALAVPSTAERHALGLNAPEPRARVASTQAQQQARSSALASAAAAQEQVAQVKSLVSDVYARADTAASLALTQADQQGPVSAAEQVRAASQAVVAAAAARGQATAAQRASNQWVAAALDLATCQVDKGNCNAPLQRAGDAESDFKRHLAAAREQYDITRLAGYNIQAATQFTQKQDREDAVRLLRTLDEYPDARGLFGPDAYRLSASTAGAQASIKLTFGRRGPASVGQTSLIVSTPAADRGNTSLYQSADGLAAATTFELGHARTAGFGRAGDFFTGLKAWGLSLRVGHEKREFYELNDLATARHRTVLPWSVNAYGAYAGLKSPVMALFRLSVQRAYDDQPPSVTCPVPIEGESTKFGCLNASIGAPAASFARVYSLELRQTGGGPSVAATVSYNDRKRVTDVTVPFYLIRNGDDTSGSTYNAGVQLGWSSKSGGSIGVFVGAPFSLLSLD